MKFKQPSKNDFNVKEKTIKLLNYVIFFAAINVVLGVFFWNSNITTNYQATPAEKKNIITAMFITIVFSFTFLGFILGSIFSFIPFKDLPYSKKLVLFSLFIILIFQIITTLVKAISFLL